MVVEDEVDVEVVQLEVVVEVVEEVHQPEAVVLLRDSPVFLTSSRCSSLSIPSFVSHPN